MAAILGIGNATLDIIHTVDGYPQENDEIRCSRRVKRRGGNVANTLVVLGQLGHACSWAGVLAASPEGQFIRNDLEANGVDTRTCRVVDTGSVPVSSILLNAATGSRTIVHFRDLPEIDFADFMSAEPGRFDWLHFEGRNAGELMPMLEWSRRHYPAIPCSLEIEKPRPGIESTFGLVDVLLFSEVYAHQHGHETPASLLGAVHRRCPGADLYCTWGAEGAAAMDRYGRLHRQPAIPPSRVVDTLGAGDTFNAAVINGHIARLETAGLLRQACALAGRKCGQTGFAGLAVEGGMS